MNFLLIIIPAILIIVSQAYIKCSYNKYREFSVKSGKSGYETAREILDSNGLSDVRIVKIGGELTDNFNPKTNTISLSSDIYDDKSIASVSVAAHDMYSLSVLYKTPDPRLTEGFPDFRP